jgi:anti-sigma-K factor RskA
MIDDPTQDLAVAYILEELSPTDATRVEAQMRTDPGLALLVEELRESTAALALALPAHMPSAHLRRKVLAGIRSEASKPQSARIAAFPLWKPVLAGLAACLAIGLAVVGYDDQKARTQLSLVSQDLFALREKASDQRARIADLEKRDSLSKVRIALLSAQVAELAKASVVVVWDAEKQRGIIKLVDMPKPAPGKDYQLWVIDPRYSAPVSAGVLAIGNAASTVAYFKPNQVITSANTFAISIEKTGGASRPEGQIVLVSQ